MKKETAWAIIMVLVALLSVISVIFLISMF
jgi:hypothetical protein